MLRLVREWPATAAGLVREQEELADATPPPWQWTEGAAVAGCFVCFVRGKSAPGEADHPAWAGAARAFALHLGPVLDVSTIGITHRLLVADGDWPADEGGAASPFDVEGERAGYWLRTRRGTRPLAVHAAWRTDAAAAVAAAAAIIGPTRTLEPLREARRLARTARARGD